MVRTNWHVTRAALLTFDLCFRGAEPLVLNVLRPTIRPYTGIIDACLHWLELGGDFLFLLLSLPYHMLVSWWNSTDDDEPIIVKTSQDTAGDKTEEVTTTLPPLFPEPKVQPPVGGDFDPYFAARCDQIAAVIVVQYCQLIQHAIRYPTRLNNITTSIIVSHEKSTQTRIEITNTLLICREQAHPKCI